MPHVQVPADLLLRCPTVAPTTFGYFAGAKARPIRSRPAALALALAASLGTAAAFADEPHPGSEIAARSSEIAANGSEIAAHDSEIGARDATAATLTVVHGDASVQLAAADLGATPVRDDAGAIDAVRWDGARLLTQCDALSDSLGLTPPFDGDIDLDDDTATAILPVAGEGVDCGALALRVERSFASGAPWTFDAPIAPREPHVRASAVETLAADVRALLLGPVTLDVTFHGERAGAVTITPDDVRDALHVRVALDPPRIEATLRPAALRDSLDPVLAPLGEPAEDAGFALGADGSVRVVPGKRGVRVDGAALFAQAAVAAKTPAKTGAVAATKTEPALATKKAQDLGIKNLVATFTTKHPCCQPRVTNIHKIATLLDGAIVEPGERFSVNRHVGKRTAKKGFVLAPSIGEGEFVETIGGGVSQMATTLYNAVFDAGYAVVSRKPHTFYFTRYPMGVEATLSWPRPDFVFRNDSKAGVLIKASFTDDSVTVKLYGDNGGRKVTRVVSKAFDSTDPRTDYAPDETLAMDKQKVKDAGTQGFTVKAGRDITFADGTKKHEERKVIYHGKPRVVAAHPCAIPKGEKGRRKKGCPKPGAEPADKDVAKADDKKQGDKNSPATKADDKKQGDKKSPANKVEDKKSSPSKAPADKAVATKSGDAKKQEDKPSPASADKPVATKPESSAVPATSGAATVPAKLEPPKSDE